MAGLEQRFIRLIAGESTGILAGAARAGLAGAEHLFAVAVRRRNRAYDTRPDLSAELPRPTISVGNITTGGTGKTPFVRWLAAELLARGVRPAVLLRGYKSVDGHSDEARLLATPLPGASAAPHVVADPDRRRGASRAVEEHPDTTCFLLDDGFQHRRVRRRLDIVLVDASRPFGFGHLLPRGLLREPPSALGRADIVVITRRQQLDAAALLALRQELSRLTHAPVLAIGEQVSGFFTLSNQPAAPPTGPVLAACGIGNPSAFVTSLEAMLHRPVASLALGDHAGLDARDVATIANAARRHCARTIVVTEKDAVKLSARVTQSLPVPVLWARHELLIDSEEAAALLAMSLKAVC